MKKKIYMVLLTVAAVLLPSCVSQHTATKQYSPFTPNEKRLYMTMNDYEYLGEVTMEVTYKTYFGAIKKILTINGEAYNTRSYRSTDINWDQRVEMSSVMTKALYKVADTYPAADYFIPVRQDKQYDHMFGGKYVKETMTVKVFQLRQRSHAEMEAERQRDKDEHHAAIRRHKEENEAMQRRIDELQHQLDEAQNALQREKNAHQNGQRRR